MSVASTATPPNPRRMSQAEFVALIGMMVASVAFSIDAMLPAFPKIAGELTPDAPNSAQLIITTFFIGMAVGIFLVGPISDSVGRRPVVLGGAFLYIVGALIAWQSGTFEGILIGRAVQGLGAAGPRVVALAIVRDLFEGRHMARIVSFAMIIFTVFPAIAPLIGSAVISAFGWRSIFLAFIVFSVTSVTWYMVRQPETLPKERRLPFAFAQQKASAIEVATHPIVLRSIVVQSFIFGFLFGMISSIQPIFDTTFNLADQFPMWFAAIAGISILPNIINAAIVVRLGMRRLIRSALIALLGITTFVAGLFLLVTLDSGTQFWIYLLWTLAVFSTLGFTIGNLNALALQPMGHIAGTAASVMGALSTLFGGLLGAPLGLLFDGTPLPLALGTLLYLAVAVAVMWNFPKVDG